MESLLLCYHIICSLAEALFCHCL